MFLCHTERGFVSLGDLFGLLNAVELNMAVAGEVGADATVGTVGSSAARNGALDNDVIDDTGVNVKFSCLSVGLEVEKELAHGLEGLLGPPTLSVLKFFGLGVTTDTTDIPAERNNLLVLKTILHVVDGSLEFHALRGSCHFVSVLVVGTQVRDPALSRYCEKRDRDTIRDHKQFETR